MQLLTQLGRWEKKLEKGPREKLIRLFSILFILSLLVGFSLSAGLRMIYAKTWEKTITEIKQQEAKRMQVRVEELRALYYVKK